MNITGCELPELPEALSRSIKGKDSGTASTRLAVLHNRLSLGRTAGLLVLSLLRNTTATVTALRILVR